MGSLRRNVLSIIKNYRMLNKRIKKRTKTEKNC